MDIFASDSTNIASQCVHGGTWTVFATFMFNSTRSYHGSAASCLTG